MTESSNLSLLQNFWSIEGISDGENRAWLWEHEPLHSQPQQRRENNPRNWFLQRFVVLVTIWPKLQVCESRRGVQWEARWIQNHFQNGWWQFYKDYNLTWSSISLQNHTVYLALHIRVPIMPLLGIWLWVIKYLIDGDDEISVSSLHKVLATVM